MPKQTKTKQGTRSKKAVAKPQAAAPVARRPTPYLETIAGPPGPGIGYIICARFQQWWEALRQQIESDIRRIRAEATANYDEHTKRLLEVRAKDAECRLPDLDVITEIIGERLIAIEDAFGNAQDDVQNAEEKLRKGRSRTGSKRTR
jgi:hypothetical protein